MDDLFEQFANISKAHAYDIISDHQKELKELVSQLIGVGELDKLTFTDEEITVHFKSILNKIKIYL